MIIVLTSISFLAVLDRFILHFGLGWTVETCRFLLIWTSFLSAVVATEKKSHFAVLYFVEKYCPPSKMKYWKLLLLIICLFLSVPVLLKGVILTMAMNNSFSPALDMPMSWLYSALPVSFFFIIYIFIFQIIEEINN
jgi:TRAP-type C4-dicarboxylate transport system permease small subunit